jgi:small subunit ribosomal protein S4
LARYIGPKHRLERSAGESLDLKSLASKSREKRLNVPPGQHGQKGKKKQSDFAVQFHAKQKARRIYGLQEKQFRKYFEIGKTQKGKTGDVILQMLEKRLDNIVYRLGFAPTRAAARQAVSHGHVQINGKKNNIPSYQVNLNEVITTDSKLNLIDKDKVPPVWLAKQGGAGKVVKIPERSDIDTKIDDQLIVEFYSR